MSKLDELIAELCPDGVEYRELHEVSQITMGTSPNGNTISSDPQNGIEFHQGKSCFGNILLGYSSIFTTLPIKVAEAGSIVMSVRAPVGDTNITERKIAIGRGLCAIAGKSPIETKFIYYCLNAFVNEIKKKSTGSTFDAINTDDVRSIKIPIPPLPIKQEIVRILDTFTELEAELEAELEERKKQYEYYRDKLLTFGDDVEYKKLRAICEIKRGVRVVRNQLKQKGEYPVYQNSMIPLGYYDKKNAEANTTFIITAGAAGEVGYSNVDFWAADDCFALICPKSLNNKFLYYYLKTQQEYLFSRVRRASVPRISRVVFEALQIPIPPLSEQERIVAILDRFDALCNDLTSGLPAEIEARRKQYEYYRDKLLTFREAKA